MKARTVKNRKTQRVISKFLNQRPQKAGDITPAPYNPRDITPEQLETLGRTMKEFGDLGGIVFNVRTGSTVGGHQRVKQLEPSWAISKRDYQDSTGTVSVGYIQTPYGQFAYREVDWPLEKEQAANLAANKVGGDFNYQSVSNILDGIDSKFDITLTGFDRDEIKDLLDGMKSAGPNTDTTPKPLKSVFELVIECDSEDHQRELFEKLSKQGMQCRVLTL